MSVLIQAYVKFNNNIKPERLSDLCFDYVEAACVKRIAIHHVEIEKSVPCDNECELRFDISDSFYFEVAETFFQMDFSLENPFEARYFKKLEELLKHIYDTPEVEKLRLYIATYEYGVFPEQLIRIPCDINSLVEKHSHNFLGRYFGDEAYEFIFDKNQ